MPIEIGPWPVGNMRWSNRRGGPAITCPMSYPWSTPGRGGGRDLPADGIAALKEHARQFVGKVSVPRYEMPNVKIRTNGDMAILRFNWETYSADSELTSRWKATEVFIRSDEHWKYAHIHWAPINRKA
jgi:Domain of unknown function (DUF4440)